MDALNSVQSESGTGSSQNERTLSELTQQFDGHPNQITE